MQKNRKISTGRKILVGFIFLMAFLSYYPYQLVFTPNVAIEENHVYFKIKTGSTFDDVAHNLRDYNIIGDYTSFRFISKLMKYQENVKPGLYKIEKGMTNIQLVRMLRNKGKTVKVTFNNLRTKKDLASKICENIEANTSTFLDMLNNPTLVEQYGFDTFSIISMFIPNTYEFYWNTSEKEVFDKMKSEYDKFWNEQRLAKAKEINLTPAQVSALASIVEAEQRRVPSERPRIAGVYMNRLRIKMPLQADPTLVFAHQDFSIKRVYDVHKQIDSPYNTYMYSGLPPGPINTPSINSIDAVLNHESHEYLYFCAKGGGLHSFTKSYRQQINNANKYRRLLDQQGIE